MEQRIIRLSIRGSYVFGAGGEIGAKGSHDEVLMSMDFTDSPLWEGLSRRAIFTDALGQNPTPILLTPNMRPEPSVERYLVPVPYEAKAAEGSAFLSIEGFIVDAESGRELVKVVTEEVTFPVLPSKIYLPENADVTPDQAQQLTAAVDSIDKTLQAHLAADNPHHITPEGIGAAGQADLDALGAVFERHTKRYNPHGISTYTLGFASYTSTTAADDPAKVITKKADGEVRDGTIISVRLDNGAELAPKTNLSIQFSGEVVTYPVYDRWGHKIGTHGFDLPKGGVMLLQKQADSRYVLLGPDAPTRIDLDAIGLSWAAAQNDPQTVTLKDAYTQWLTERMGNPWTRAAGLHIVSATDGVDVQMGSYTANDPSNALAGFTMWSDIDVDHMVMLDVRFPKITLSIVRIGGGGAVNSVNNRTGDVVIIPADIGQRMYTCDSPADASFKSIGDAPDVHDGSVITVQFTDGNNCNDPAGIYIDGRNDDGGFSKVVRSRNGDITGPQFELLSNGYMTMQLVGDAFVLLTDGGANADVEKDLQAHLAADNPHHITPEGIGAAAAPADLGCTFLVCDAPANKGLKRAKGPGEEHVAAGSVLTVQFTNGNTVTEGYMLAVGDCLGTVYTRDNCNYGSILAVPAGGFATLQYIGGKYVQLGDRTPDTAVSDTSENAVSSKAVKTYVDGLVGVIDQLVGGGIVNG